MQGLMVTSSSEPSHSFQAAFSARLCEKEGSRVSPPIHVYLHRSLALTLEAMYMSAGEASLPFSLHSLIDLSLTSSSV